MGTKSVSERSPNVKARSGKAPIAEQALKKNKTLLAQASTPTSSNQNSKQDLPKQDRQINSVLEEPMVKSSDSGDGSDSDDISQT